MSHMRRLSTQECLGSASIFLVLACTVLLSGNAEAQSGLASVYSYKSGRTASGERAHPLDLRRRIAACRSAPGCGLRADAVVAPSSCVLMTAAPLCADGSSMSPPPVHALSAFPGSRLLPWP